MHDTRTTRARILVVDDNEANGSLLQHVLEDEGYTVSLARGGAEGIASFEKECPDCVLLDIRMPDIDGFAVCERIRAMPHGPETPVLFLTALRDVDTFDHALRAGGDDFLTKPVRPGELVVRVQSALKLRRLSAELREHYALLKDQRDEMLRLQLHKERLTAFVVHDLKNPVNSVDLHAQLLERNPGVPANARASVAAIRSEVRQLTRMISNLLDISKAGEGQLAPRRTAVDLRPLVDEVLSELGANAELAHVELRASVATGRIDVDRDLFRRVLTNLVENAIRYSPRESAVTVTATRLSSATELRVADAGSGIAPEMRDKVFDAFVHAESESGHVARGGRGLGLTFCKVAVDAHGGRIWVEEGAPGAVFCVSIPRRSGRARSTRSGTAGSLGPPGC